MKEIRNFIMIPDRKIKEKDQNKVEVHQASIFLDLFNMCQGINVLPRPGGLLDQDSFYVTLMRYALLCQHDKQKLDDAKRSMDSA